MSRVLRFTSITSQRKSNTENSVSKHHPLEENSKIIRMLRTCTDAFNKNVKEKFPHVSFITLHYVYFIATCLISSIIFWGSSTPSQSVRFIDSIFLTTSAMTEAGLNTVNLSELNTWQQVILLLLIIMGSAIFVSSAVIHVRKRAFERKLQDLADRRRKRLLRPRSLTFTFSKRRASDANRHVAEVASGAVRGRAIHDKPASSEQDDQVADGGAPLTREETSIERLGNRGATEGRHITFDETANLPPLGSLPLHSHSRGLSRILSNTGVGAHRLDYHPRHAAPTIDEFEASALDDADDDDAQIELPKSPAKSKLDKYIESANGYIGRNSQFHHLTEKERRMLGGIEYDALCVLSWVVPLYFILFQLFGVIGCGAWMLINRPDTAKINGLDPFWTGAFFAVSAFNNSGMALLDANATALQTSYYMLLTLSLLILAGNTCFPPFLRLILWILKKLIPKNAASPRWKKWRQVLTFVLDHPRRVYTNLFPSAPTWWLVCSLVLLNGIDWLAFEVLNFGNPIVESIPARFRALDGLFQAFAVRAGGFYVVAISGLYPGTLVLYVLMMYLSAFPVTMTIRNTNVYEERSLAIFSDDHPDDQEQNLGEKQSDPSESRSPFGIVRTLTGQALSRQHTAPSQSKNQTWSRQDFIRQQLRSQLGHDLWWISLAILFITIIETSQAHRDPVVFSVFNIIFEVISAYGTVGISVGVPWAAYSFCGAWHTGSKLILCAVMLRGRHRGLPVAIDRAILLPSSSLAWAEEEDSRYKHHHHHHRRASNSFGRTRTGDAGSSMSRQTTRRLSGDPEQMGVAIRKRRTERDEDADEMRDREKPEGDEMV